MDKENVELYKNYLDSMGDIAFHNAITSKGTPRGCYWEGVEIGFQEALKTLNEFIMKDEIK